MNKNTLIKGTIILTVAGLITKILGFVLRIFLSRFLGAEGLGIYQLVFPVFSLGIVISSYGIQTAISRYVSASSNANPADQIKYLKAGASLSLGLSLLFSAILYNLAVPVSNFILNESRCASLIRVAAFCIPLESIHICINGFYYGRKKTGVPAFSQFVEQTFRILGIYLLFTITEKNNLVFTPLHAVGGNLIGDVFCLLFVSTALTFIKKQKNTSHTTSYPLIYGNLLKIALPLSCNQTLVHIFHSVETVLIPTMLQNYGYSVSQALSIYGVLTGMALPLLMFPSTLTNSFAVLLLPTISEANANGQRERMVSVTRGAVSTCTLLGIFSTGFFLFLGEETGMVLFQNREVGNYLRILSFLCPFLFLNITLGSVLNGLGKASLVFRNNMINLGIRILFMVFVIPKFGITGFFLGFLVSSIITTFLFFFSIRSFKMPLLDSLNFIAKPCISLSFSYFCIRLLSWFDTFRFCTTLSLLGLKSLLFFMLYIGFLKLLIPGFSLKLLTNPDKSLIVKRNNF